MPRHTKNRLSLNSQKGLFYFFYLWKHVAYPQIIGARRKLTDRTHIERYQTSAPKQNLCPYKMTNNSRLVRSYREKSYSYLDHNIEFNARYKYISISKKNKALWSKIVLFSFESKWENIVSILLTKIAIFLHFHGDLMFTLRHLYIKQLLTLQTRHLLK